MGPHPCYRTGTRDATVPAPGYPRDSVGRSDDAIAVAMASSSNNGGTARSLVGVVPPQPFHLYGHVIHDRGTGRPRPLAAVPALLRDPLYSFNNLLEDTTANMCCL